MDAPADAPASRVGRPFRLGHRPALDGLRGISILLVLSCHSPIIDYLPGGGVGVDIFFVLSGFLITSLLCEEWERSGRIRLPRFYARRALRLLPALGALLLLSVPFNYFVYGLEAIKPGLWDALAVGLYYYNWVVSLTGKVQTWYFCHTWSLCVEEQFYLLWPIAFAVLLRMKLRRRTIFAILAVAALVPVVLRIAYLASIRDAQLALYRISYASDTRADQLIVGCLLGMVASWNRLPERRWGQRLLKAGVAVGAAILTIDFLLFAPPPWYSLAARFTVVAAATALCIAALLQDSFPRITRRLEAPWLMWLGQRSYGLYLWHIPVFLVLIGDPYAWSETRLAGLGVSVLAFGIAIFASQISFVAIERPFLRLKDRVREIEPERSSLATTPAPAERRRSA